MNQREAEQMPIANCIVAPRSDKVDPDDIVRSWSERSGIGSDEMTVNLTYGQQGGKRYAAMAWLHLPTLWSATDMETLGEALAHALADVCRVPPSDVQVILSVVNAGFVIEDGKTLRW